MAWASNTFMYGWLFTVTEEKTVKGVGFYDDGQNGLSNEYMVRILVLDDETYPDPIEWIYGITLDADGNVPDITIPSGTTAGLSGSWRRVDLATSVQGATLSPGALYAAVAFNPNLSGGIRRPGSDAVVKNVSNLVLPSGVVYGHNITQGTTGSGIQLQTVLADGTAYFGPMIFFEEVPG
jgi:hypothetical protein